MRVFSLVAACVLSCWSASAAFAQPALSQNPELGGEITGIVSRCGQQSITGVSVYIPGESFQAHLAADGSFRLRYVPPGTYTLVFETSGQTLHTILTPEFITATAQQLKLDAAKFDTCLASGRHDAGIQKDSADAASVGITGTPSFVIGYTTGSELEGVRIVGTAPFGSFDARFKQLLAEKPGAK